MHVLYFHQHYTNTTGGGGTRSYEFAKRLLSAGHTVTMVCGRYANGVTGLTGAFTNGIRTGHVEGIHIIELDLPYSNADSFIKRTMTFLRYSYRAIMIAMRQNYDVVFATSTPLTAGIPGIFAKVLRRKPFVFEVRDLWPELPKAMGVITNPLVLSAMACLERWSYRAADHCIGLAPGIVKGIQQQAIPAARISMIPNACDHALFENPQQTMAIPGIEPQDFVAIFAGAHGLANGLEAMLDVAVVLKQRQVKHIKILFVGDGKLKPALMLRAEREALHHCVFVSTVSKQSITQYYARANAGLMILKNVPAFYFGTSPNKFFDYLAAGLPVICNYPGWVSELLHEYKCGKMVTPENPQMFADVLMNWAAHPEEVHQMGMQAKTLSKQFDRNVLADRFVNVLEGVVRNDHVSPCR